MWLNICTCLVLFNVVKSGQVQNLKLTNDNTDAPKQAETVFADVIKNISRVNNVLQELINNYEQLQKIYKSQENDESRISDSEIDEIFKSKKVKEAKRTKNEDVATKKPISEKFAATQMFWSDHDEDNDNSDNDDDSAESLEVKETDAMKEKEKKIAIIKPELQGLSTTRKTTTSKPVTSSSETSDESSDLSITKEKVKKPKENGLKKPVKKIKILNLAKPKLQRAEVIFVDTHKKGAVDTYMKQQEVKSMPKIEPGIQYVGVPSKPKTRYSKVSHNKQVKQVVQNIMPQVGLNNTRKVKQIMYSESFSPEKIWNDIINNKPIQLEAHNEITIERLEKDKNDTGFNLRSKNGKKALVIVTKTKKNKNEEFISSEDDDVTKEELKANVLRHAYGDACLKLVVRKCHEACKKVSKSVCNRVKCKSEAKALFKSYSKAGCIEEFRGNGIEQERAGNNRKVQGLSGNSKINYRGQDESSTTDLTRSGFLPAACFPVQELKDANETVSLKAAPDKSFNVLRDRFERACKKISSNKCNNACKSSYTKMCETHKCAKRMKKLFKKTCQSQCRNAYQLYDDSSDSDDASDDSNSDEDSDDSDASSD